MNNIINNNNNTTPAAALVPNAPPGAPSRVLRRGKRLLFDDEVAAAGAAGAAGDPQGTEVAAGAEGAEGIHWTQHAEQDVLPEVRALRIACQPEQQTQTLFIELEYTGVIHLSIDIERSAEYEKHLVFSEILDIPLTSGTWRDLFLNFQAFSIAQFQTPEERFHFALGVHDLKARTFLRIPELPDNVKWCLMNQFMDDNADFIFRFLDANASLFH